MKRNNIYKACLAIVLMVIALVGCTEGIYFNAKGSVAISVKDVTAKGIEANISLDPVYYLITGIGPNEGSVSGRIDAINNEVTYDNLNAGEWRFEAFAYNEDNLVIAKGVGTCVVQHGRETELLIDIYEITGTGTLEINLSNVSSDDEYFLHVYKINNGNKTEIGERIRFDSVNGILTASMQLENGFYIFEVLSQSDLLNAPLSDVVRIVKDDLISLHYSLDEEGGYSSSAERDNEPVINIVFSSKEIDPDTVIQGKVEVAGNLSDDYYFEWYIDNVKYYSTNSFVEFTYDDIGVGDHILSCVVKNSDSSFIKTYSIEVAGYESVSRPESYLAINEDGSIYSTDTSVTSVAIPEYIDGIKVTAIADRGFQSCSSLRSISIPEHISAIGDMAFVYSGLESIIIPDSVESVGVGLFHDCTSLESIYLGSGVNSLDSIYYNYWTYYFFGNCSSLKIVIIPNSVSTLNKCFYDCDSLEAIVLPEGLISIGESAFEGCSGLRSLIIPESVTSIGDQAFKGCISLTSIEIPDKVTSLGGGLFYGCSSLTNVDIPSHITYLYASFPYDNSAIGMFEGCTSLVSVKLPDSLYYLDKNIFRNCFSLERILIPDSISSIAPGAFENCKSLKSISLSKNINTIGDEYLNGEVFKGCVALEAIYLDVERFSITGDPWGAPDARIYWAGDF